MEKTLTFGQITVRHIIYSICWSNGNIAEGKVKIDSFGVKLIESNTNSKITIVSPQKSNPFVIDYENLSKTSFSENYTTYFTSLTEATEFSQQAVLNAISFYEGKIQELNDTIKGIRVNFYDLLNNK